MAYQQPKMTLGISYLRISEVVISFLLKNFIGVLPKVSLKHQTQMAIIKMSINCSVKTTRDIRFMSTLEGCLVYKQWSKVG